MLNPRSITSPTSIPLGVAGTGTVASLPTDNTILQVTGGDYTQFALFVGLQNYDNTWIYLTPGAKTARVVSIIPQSATVFFLCLDRPMPAVVADTFTIITANLVRYSVLNAGGAAGSFNNVALPAGAAFDMELRNEGGLHNNQYCDAVPVDGTGTTIVVQEES